MAVLTISRELGSRGGTVAREAARALGYRLAGKDLLGTILGEYGLIEFDEEYDANRGFWDYFDRRVGDMIEMLNKAMLAIAATDDVVIVGRGAFALLRGYEDVVNARIQAPFEERARRVAERDGMSDPAKAIEAVRRSDRTRASFIESAFGIDWDRCGDFDVVIDTKAVSVDTAASWLAEAVEEARARPRGGGRRVAGIEVDETLAEAVRDAFRRREDVIAL